MATYNADIVSVDVTYDSSGVSAEGFTTPLFVSHHNVFSTRQVAYTSLSEMTTAGFAVGSPAYTFASNCWQGKQAPSTIIIARAVPDSYTIQVDTTAEEDDALGVYVKLDGSSTTVSYTVLSTDTTSQLLGDGLATELAAVDGVTSAVSDSEGLITITLDDDSLATSFGVKENTTIYVATSEAATDIITAVEEEYTDYAIICAETHVTTQQEEYLSYTETADKLYVFSTQDEDAYDSTEEGDIAYIYSDLEYQYSCGMYKTDADTEFPEGALVGTFAAQSPSYSFTANLQTLVGQSTDTLTSSQKIALTGKNCSYYIEEYDDGNFHEGWTGNADFLDRSRFGLWLKVRSQESLYNTMKSLANKSSALAYSDVGIAIAKTNLYADVISTGITNGTILTGTSEDSDGDLFNYTPVIDVSTRASQTSANISNRTWTGFTITLYYTGSIHHIDADAYILNS